MLWAAPTDHHPALCEQLSTGSKYADTRSGKLLRLRVKMEAATFANQRNRKRLQPAAVAGIRRIAAAWRLPGTQAAALLATSPSTWYRIGAGTWRGTFSQDQMTRVSALVGSYKGLHLLFADAMADRWPRLPNGGRLFGGRTPIEAMIEGAYRL